eukprot:tig00000391_g24836.t1
MASDAPVTDAAAVAADYIGCFMDAAYAKNSFGSFAESSGDFSTIEIAQVDGLELQLILETVGFEASEAADEQAVRDAFAAFDEDEDGGLDESEWAALVDAYTACQTEPVESDINEDDDPKDDVSELVGGSAEESPLDLL